MPPRGRPKKKVEETSKGPCSWHPPTRRIGDTCMECGHKITKEKK